MLTVDHVGNGARVASLRRGTAPHPIDAATSALTAALASAYERDDAGSVRILHAVLALLAATPKRRQQAGGPHVA